MPTTITTNIVDFAQLRINAYHTLAQKATGAGETSHQNSGVGAALKRFFYKLDFLLKYGQFPSGEDAAQNALPEELRGLRAFLEIPQDDGKSYILQKDVNTRYRFTWSEDDKVTVTEEGRYLSPAGARTGYASVESWRKGNSQECELNGLLAVLGVPKVLVENRCLINEKLDSFSQKLSKISLSTSEKECLSHEMGALKVTLHKTLISIDANLFNDSEYIDSALERAIFMFSLQQLSKVTNGNVTKSFCLRINHSLLSDKDYTETNPAVLLCDKSTDTSLAKLPLKSIGLNLATISKLKSMDWGNVSNLAQLLLSIPISFSYRSVEADILGGTNACLSGPDLSEIEMQLSNLYQCEFSVSINKLRQEYDLSDCPIINTKQKDAWARIHEWFMSRDVEVQSESWVSGKRVSIPGNVCQSIFNLLGGEWTQK